MSSRKTNFVHLIGSESVLGRFAAMGPCVDGGRHLLYQYYNMLNRKLLYIYSNFESKN